MKYITALLLIFGGIGAALLFALKSGATTSDLPPGSLTIEHVPQDLVVTIDGEVWGDQFTQQQIPTGSHFVSIGDLWQTSAQVASQKESRIWRKFIPETGESYGYTVEYEDISGVFQQQNRIALTSTPSGAEVYEGERLLGTTPLTIKDQPEQQHNVMFVVDGHVSMHVSFDVYSSVLTSVHVDSVFAPLEDIQKVDTSDISLPSPNQRSVVTRNQWGGDPITSLRQHSRVEEWHSLDVRAVRVHDLPHGNPEKIAPVLKNFDAVARETYNMMGIPYAYLIDEDGIIYEGLGVFNYDFNQIDSRLFPPRVAPVLILQSRDAVLSEPVVESLSYLFSLLGSEPSLRAIPIQESIDISLEYGERYEIPVQWKNAGNTILGGEIGMPIRINKLDEHDSRLYDPITWDSPRQIAATLKDTILPGETATVPVVVQAPYIPVQETLSIELVSMSDVVEHSKLTINVTVTGNSENVLRIDASPQGYLPIRQEPSNEAALVGAVYESEEFVWEAKRDSWYHIVLRDGTKGWVTSQYVTEL